MESKRFMVDQPDSKDEDNTIDDAETASAEDISPENDASAPEPVCSRLDETVFHDDVGTQRLQTGDMQIHGPRTDRTATRQ